MFSLGEFRLSLGFLFGGQSSLFGVAFGRSLRCLVLLASASLLQFGLALRFIEFSLPSGCFFRIGLLPTALIEPFLSKLPVALILLSQQILNRGQFTVEVLFGLAKSHAGVLL